MYIRPDAFILVPALYFIGLFLKQTPQLPPWIHPWILMAFAILACMLHYGWAIESAVQGILVTGVAVISRDIIENTLTGINQHKETKKKDDHKK
ncbi:phage holin family protein [Bacillus benzoevorans]|uniref:DMSO reductase anchor subunit n=2 Tax=Bacillus benzoevorans TaxID=1456 RepID=A0A7X0HUC8_9BACI|nr:DMSO reductase anchor subunit [Bacillus benzoevorans]